MVAVDRAAGDMARDAAFGDSACYVEVNVLGYYALVQLTHPI